MPATESWGGERRGRELVEKRSEGESGRWRRGEERSMGEGKGEK